MSMSPAIADERRLVTIEHIRKISPIDNADSIELAKVRGWDVVVAKGQFRAGDNVLYLEVDSLLPLDDARFAFLAPQGERIVDGVRYHRLKTARKRGVYSQGLVMPIGDFPEVIESTLVPPDHNEFHVQPDPSTVPDLAALLGVVKFDEELPGTASGPFPTALARKTGSERVQNLLDAWPALVAAGPWLATEKADGVSCTAVRDADGVLRVCGRNWEVPDGANVYWDTVRDFAIDGNLEPGECVQFEIIGDGVRKNPLRLDARTLPDVVHGRMIAIFGHSLNGVPTPWAERLEWARVWSAPILDLPFPATVDEALAQVDQRVSAINPARPAEGIVWHRASAEPLPELGYRSSFKVLSARYVVKHDS